MFSKRSIPFMLGLMALALLLAACGSQPATLADIPTYPEAVVLVAGEDPIADTLIQNMEQDAALRGNLGVGGQIEQQAFRLPAGTTWDQVESFYSEALEGEGWESGLGGPGGNLASDIMNSVNTSNELLQTGIWSRDKQTLTLIRTANPTDEAALYLLISLNTN